MCTRNPCPPPAPAGHWRPEATSIRRAPTTAAATCARPSPLSLFTLALISYTTTLSPTQAPPPYEYGDLSGKHGKLNAASGGSFVGTGRGFVTDATLPLSGDWSVLSYVTVGNSH